MTPGRVVLPKRRAPGLFTSCTAIPPQIPDIHGVIHLPPGVTVTYQPVKPFTFPVIWEDGRA